LNNWVSKSELLMLTNLQANRSIGALPFSGVMNFFSEMKTWPLN